MSKTALPQSPLEFRYGYAAQSVWGTAIADNQAFTELSCEHIDINPDIKEVVVDGAHGTRTKKIGDYLYHTNESMPSWNVNAIAKLTELDHFLYGVGLSVVEAATTPYKKTFTLPSTQANYISNAGHFFTFIARDPGSSLSTKVTDAVLRSLTMSVVKGEPLRFESEWVGRGVPSFTSNPSGTWTVSANTFWDCADIVRANVNFGSGAVSFQIDKFSLTIAHEIVPFGQTGSSKPSGIALVNRDVTFELTVVKDSDYNTALTNWSGNTPVSINVAWGGTTAGNTSGDLDFTLYGKLNSVTKASDDVVVGTLSGFCCENAGGTTAAATIIMANAVDRTW